MSFAGLVGLALSKSSDVPWHLTSFDYDFIIFHLSFRMKIQLVTLLKRNFIFQVFGGESDGIRCQVWELRNHTPMMWTLLWKSFARRFFGSTLITYNPKNSNQWITLKCCAQLPSDAGFSCQMHLWRKVDNRTLEMKTGKRILFSRVTLTWNDLKSERNQWVCQCARCATIVQVLPTTMEEWVVQIQSR